MAQKKCLSVAVCAVGHLTCSIREANSQSPAEAAKRPVALSSREPPSPTPSSAKPGGRDRDAEREGQREQCASAHRRLAGNVLHRTDGLWLALIVHPLSLAP